MKVGYLVLDWGRAIVALVLGLYLAGWYAPESNAARWVAAGALIGGEYVSGALFRLALGQPSMVEPGSSPRRLKAWTAYAMATAGPTLSALIAGIVVAGWMQTAFSPVGVVAVFTACGLVLGAPLGLLDRLGLVPGFYPKPKKKKKKAA